MSIWITCTYIVSDKDEPFGELATTDIVPPVLPAYAVMEVDVDDPVHPEGNVQVYEVAPVAAGIEYIASNPFFHYHKF